MYLDHNATTPLSPDVLEEMMPYLKLNFGNPSSVHHEGRVTREAVEAARDKVASVIKAKSSEIIFTGSGTESNNAVFWGLFNSEDFQKFPVQERRAFVSPIEHPSVLAAAERFSRQGGQLHFMNTDSEGFVDLDALEKLLVSERSSKVPSLVSVMIANNEVGTIQSIESLASIVKKYGGLLHCDAVAALGKVAIDLSEIPIDFMSVSAHKVYGPNGVGALFIRKGIDISPMLLGGHQENGHRAGTENVPGVVGLGAACILAQKVLRSESERLTALSFSLWEKIKKEIPSAMLNTPLSNAVPGVLNISFPNYLGEEIMINLDIMGVSISTGSACSSGTSKTSHVLDAMGFSHQRQQGCIRISMGRTTSLENTEEFVTLLKKSMKNLQPVEYRS